MVKRKIEKPKEEIKKEEKDNITKLTEVGQTISTLRNRPLLLIFYPDEGGSIKTNDIYILENKLEKRLSGYNGELDVWIHTTGGNPQTSYLIAQLIRRYCNKMNLIIPFYAYSGGTLISLASDVISLGETSLLSPIDLQLSSRENPERFHLISIEKYIEFVEDSCKSIKFKDEKNKTDYITTMMEKLTYELKPTELGNLFRLKDLTKYYGEILLKSYMFKDDKHRDNKVNFIIDKLTGGSPDHDFDIDFQIANGIGLKVEKMDSKIYKLSRTLHSICYDLLGEGTICGFYSDKIPDRKPFFEVFNTKTGERKDE